MSIYTYSFLGLVQQLTNLTAAPSRLIKGDLFCKVPVWFFFQTSPSLTSLPYNYQHHEMKKVTFFVFSALRKVNQIKAHSFSEKEM